MCGMIGAEVNEMNYEKAVMALKNDAEQRAKIYEDDLKVYAQINHAYYIGVAEILGFALEKLQKNDSERKD